MQTIKNISFLQLLTIFIISNSNMNDFSLNALPTTIIKYEIAPYVPNNYLTYTNTEHYEKNAAMYREKLKNKYKKYLLFLIKSDLNYCLKIQIRHQNNFF